MDSKAAEREEAVFRQGLCALGTFMKCSQQKASQQIAYHSGKNTSFKPFTCSFHIGVILDEHKHITCNCGAKSYLSSILVPTCA